MFDCLISIGSPSSLCASEESLRCTLWPIVLYLVDEVGHLVYRHPYNCFYIIFLSWSSIFGWNIYILISLIARRKQVYGCRLKCVCATVEACSIAVNNRKTHLQDDTLVFAMRIA